MSEIIRIGVLGPSDIAKRRMIPAIKKNRNFEFIGVAVAQQDERKLWDKKETNHRAFSGDSATEVKRVNSNSESADKAKRIVDEFGGSIFNSYHKMLESSEIDAIYIALPPALHYYWGKMTLEYNKHLLMEKPFASKKDEACSLIEDAKKRKLAVLENFAFAYHPQIKYIKKAISDGEVGDTRFIRSNFGFPYRGENDFRYSKRLGGGALLDCGCYALKAAVLFMGDDVVIKNCSLHMTDRHNVDMYGSIIAENNDGIIAQMCFGMDQQYCCELEIWGSRGMIKSPRIYTAPEDLSVNLDLVSGMSKKPISVEQSDQFYNSLNEFFYALEDVKKREQIYKEIETQAHLMGQCGF